MKPVKILIATALISSTFYACKKEEMNIKSGELVYESESQNNLGSITEPGTTTGVIKVVFNKMGSMLIEGNPNLEYLLNMYNGSATAINSAKEVFDVKQQETLSIVFDNLGNTIASEIPSVPVGSNIDVFINDFCKVRPENDFKLAITKNSLERNYLEFWNALPAGSIENFENSIKQIQTEMQIGYTIRVQLNPGTQTINYTLLDPNGNPQPVQNSSFHCKNLFSSGLMFLTNSLNCASSALSGWF